MDEQKMPRRPRRDHDGEQPQKSESLVYGKNPVTELLKSGSGVDTVLLAEGMAPAVAAYFTAMAKEAGATVKRVHPNKLRLMTGTESHQGVAAFASEIEYVSVEDLLAAAKAKGEPPFLVLSDGIEDPHNLGAVMRSALLCGAHGIVIPKRGGAPVTPTVIKSSAGARSVCLWPAWPTSARPSAASRNRASSCTVPTWTACPCARTTSPAPSHWCWAARAAAFRNW